MTDITLTIDGKPITVPAGTSVLYAALDNGIYIPNLCAMREDESPNASCRLCWVEIDGETVPACTRTVEDGMIVDTRTEAARALAKRAFELLMASHDTDCAHCRATGHCELQKLASRLHVPITRKDLRPFLKGLPRTTATRSSPTRRTAACSAAAACAPAGGAGKQAVLALPIVDSTRRPETFGDEPSASNAWTAPPASKPAPPRATVEKK
jgi:formate dehydrogenase major subunit/NADH-quinone oxidoreductase subunit G